MATNTVEIKITEIDKVHEVLKKQNEENKRLNQRIDKAIEVLERHTRYSTKELLNILKGDSDE